MRLDLSDLDPFDESLFDRIGKANSRLPRDPLAFPTMGGLPVSAVGTVAWGGATAADRAIVDRLRGARAPAKLRDDGAPEFLGPVDIGRREAIAEVPPPAACVSPSSTAIFGDSAGPVAGKRKHGRLSGAQRRRRAKFGIEKKVAGRPHPDAKAKLEAHVYLKDVIFKMRGVNTHARKALSCRGNITKFSKDSAKRLRLFARNTAPTGIWQGFLTLTYSGVDWPRSGPEVKAHINAFCTWLRRKSIKEKKRPIAYVWVLEFQSRGAPHFHFMVSEWIGKDILAEKWHEIVTAGQPEGWGGRHKCARRPGVHSKHLCAGTQIDAVKNPDECGAYIGAYISKLDQKTVPAGFSSVGRFWGASRCLSKVVFEFEHMYREASRELRIMRRAQVGSRRKISESQGLLAKLKVVEFEKLLNSGDLRDGETTELHRLGKSAAQCGLRMHSYAKRWRYKGYGFVLIDGSREFLRKFLFHQAGAIDVGLDLWNRDAQADSSAPGFWRRSKNKKQVKYISPAKRIRAAGQLIIGGGIDPCCCPKARPCECRRRNRKEERGE